MTEVPSELVFVKDLSYLYFLADSDGQNCLGYPNAQQQCGGLADMKGLTLEAYSPRRPGDHSSYITTE